MVINFVLALSVTLNNYLLAKVKQEKHDRIGWEAIANALGDELERRIKK